VFHRWVYGNQFLIQSLCESQSDLVNLQTTTPVKEESVMESYNTKSISSGYRKSVIHGQFHKERSGWTRRGKSDQIHVNGIPALSSSPSS